jgi:L-alanine-DL-glutamate epimerase-like enolase superfamily enzyme
MPQLRVSFAVEAWPLKSAFIIARGAKTEAHVVVASVTDGTYVGRGESVPYARYGETIENVTAAIEEVGPLTDRVRLKSQLPAGAARNALDCALWDLESRQSGRSVTELAGLPPQRPLETAFTLSLGSPDDMAAAALHVPHLKLLKLKLGGNGDDQRMRAVRRARPDARIIADANEAWSEEMLVPFIECAASTGVELIEQPLPAGRDGALSNIARKVAVCADESVHTTADLESLVERYDAVNIKLDKTGGLTEALEMVKRARALGFDVMSGCMVSTSLAMAPALLIAGFARWVDLDGPLLLKEDRPLGLKIENGIIAPLAPGLWGGGS